MKTFLAKRFSTKLAAIFLILISGFIVSASTDGVDPNFNPKLTIDLPGIGGSVAIQPDGKILVFGRYAISDGSVVRSFIKRLNPDSSVDATFDCPECRALSPTVAEFQPDGKILVGGERRLIRIDQNGNLDKTFKATINVSNMVCTAKKIIYQPDGKYLIACKYIEVGLNPREFVMRLNSNGSLDTTFPLIALQTGSTPQAVVDMILQPDGKILLGGTYYGSSGGWLYRFNQNGNLDNSFQANPSGAIKGMSPLPDGSYLIATSNKISKLLTNGSVDTSFSAPISQNEAITGLKTLSNGQFYVQLYASSFPVPVPNVYRFVRYNANGSVDTAFSQTFLNPGQWVIDGSNRIVVSRDGFYRLNFDGTVDASFSPSVNAEGLAKTADLQNDGKIVVAGLFEKANGFNAAGIARINPNGTTDVSFNPGTGFNIPPSAIKVQPDGKILVGGRFSSYNGTTRPGLVRLNIDGSLDTTFNATLSVGNAPTGYVEKILVMPDGKIFVGGAFDSVNGALRRSLAKLNADGSLDNTFDPSLGNSPTIIRSILAQPDGKIMVAGDIGVRRLKSDGTVDSSFQIRGGSISDVIQRTDGKYIISSSEIPQNYTYTVVLLNNNGTIDFSLQSPQMSQRENINTIFEQPNGSIIFGGAFSDISNSPNAKNIARINSQGVGDVLFPNFGANDTVHKIIGQPDGKILFIGDFSGIEDAGRSGIARLTLNNPVVTLIAGTPFDFDGDGRSDISVFRPSTNTWYSLLSNSPLSIQNFGAAGDIPVPADYDGDQKTDLGVFRPSTGTWFYLLSQTNTVSQFNWGTAGDIPLPSDVTADGKADLVVYRPSNNVWYCNPGGSPGSFGNPGDKPLIGDFDGDGKADPAVFRPSTGVWWYAASSAGFVHRATRWGLADDIPVPADFDGDGKTDYAVFRPSNGVWYVLKSTGGYDIVQFGLSEDKPVVADYDGDGKADIAVFRPSTGVWYMMRSTAGFSAIQWGISTDVPVENAFIQ